MKSDKKNNNVAKKQARNTSINEAELKENIKNMEEMVNKKDLPKEEKNKINKRVFELSK